CTGSAADDQMRIAALDGLLSMNSEDAVPILKDVLKQRDACRMELRKRAVWLISQKRAPDVVSTLLDVARNDPSTEVRGEAIFWLSQTKGEAAIPALDSVLFSSTDLEIRKRAVFALSQFRDERARQALRRAVEDDKMPEDVRGDAIFWLGQGRTLDLEYFKGLFRKTRNEDLRNRILTSVGQSSSSEASAWLVEIARDKSFDTETRKQAIFWAGQKRSFDLEQLSTLYDQSRGDTEFQNHLLFIYSQRRESAAVDKLMAIAKSDSNIELRKQALFWLGQKNDPRVRQFIRDLINK
ncbi:MAG TPA: HEAT repeat domain-containing protein, partial [Gemmatimonadaceae bacterium]|nr:HEAT repeat domain-containing protein [Gemmatimonadaceae bacterium]